MSDIFISYASEDKNRVKSLAHALEKKGWSVWWDRRIRVSKSFDEVIQEALEASRVVVVVWTEASVKSPWVRNEAREGLNRQALFPVLLEEVKIPLEFRHVQAAHLNHWQPDQDHAGFNQLIEDLAEVIGAPVTSVVQTPTVTQSLQPSPAATSSASESSSSPKTATQVEPVRAALGSNNNLSALTVSPGSLAPAFSANTLNYTVNVGINVTNVAVSATKADPNAVISGDVSAGAGIVTGQATIQLGGPGTTTGVTIWVTAPGGSQKTYTLNVFRAALGGNNNLQSLTLSPGSLTPSFTASRTSYSVNVGSRVSSINVTATLQDTAASITVNGQGTSSGQKHTIDLGAPGSSTELEIIVIAPNGNNKTYLVTINRSVLSLASEVGTEPERQKQQPSSQERPIESTRSASSTEFLSYLPPIGIGLLVALGSVVYLAMFRLDEASYQPPTQSERTTSELIAPPPATEPIKQPSATTQEKPVTKQAAAGSGTEATKPRPIAGHSKTITGKDSAPMVLELEATALNWVVIQIDNGSPIESLMRAGEKSHWEGQDRFVLTLGNAGGVKAKLNGKPQNPFGPSGKVARDIILNREQVPQD